MSVTDGSWTPRAERILKRAHEKAVECGAVKTGVEHLFYAILEDGESVAYVAIENVASPKSIGRELVRILESEEYNRPVI